MLEAKNRERDEHNDREKAKKEMHARLIRSAMGERKTDGKVLGSDELSWGEEKMKRKNRRSSIAPDAD